MAEKISLIKTRIKLVYGCMEFSRRFNLEKSKEITDYCLASNINEFDTAYAYAGGESEVFMGKIDSYKNNTTLIATKANPLGDKTLSADSIRHQLTTSLKNLQRNTADIFYLHMPCSVTPIEETLAEVDKLHKDGLFKEFGLSNYASWQVSDIYHICKSHGWVLPTVYQGMYNPVTRSIEDELFPAIRRYGIRFYAYNPLAGGILTGKHKYDDKNSNTIPEGRFKGNMWAETYQNRYWNTNMFSAVNMLQNKLNETYGENNVSIVEATFRWMMHHSKLAHDDALILGASSMEQLKQNINACRLEPLLDSVVNEFELAWLLNKGNCPKYFR